MASDLPVQLSSSEVTGPPVKRDLKPRIVWGVALAALAIGLTWAGKWPFAGLCLVIAGLMDWEWGRVVRGREFDPAFWVHLVATTAAIVLAGFGAPVMGAAVLAIGAIVLIPLAFGQRAPMSALGVLYSGLPAVALVWLRSEDKWGLLAVLFVFATVWTTDTAAFAAGRLIGGPKLWPRVSPNKTWSGFICGVLASAGVAALFANFIPASNMLRLAVLGLGFGVVAQGGDLAESALKRVFGVKDASSLIPGHGGFLDRVDALVTVGLAAAIVALFSNLHAPAHGLLFGF